MSTAAQISRQRARILIVDDHPLVREGLAQLVNRQSDMTCCGEASTPAEAVQAVTTQQPEVAVLDLRLKNADGLELIKTLKAQFPATHILVLSQFDEAVYAERTLRAGAMGYVMKEQPAQEILKALRTVLSNEVYVSPAMSKRMLTDLFGTQPSPPAAGVEHLTDRELHVLQLLGARKSTRDIAAEMRLSAKTIETYREHLKNKLNLGDGQALVHYAEQWVANQFASRPSKQVAHPVGSKTGLR